MADEQSPLLRTNSRQSALSVHPELHAQVSCDPEESTKDTPESEERPAQNLNIYTILPVLLLGVLVSNIDETLVLASGSTIASEFDALSRSGWLVSSYSLAICATQPMYGRFSEEFGRKAMILTSYTFFSVGCCLSAVGTSYAAVLAGRALAGAGGAGMFSLASLVIADMIPVRSVAAWRSVFSMASTMGRSIGGPVGGLFTDKIGWRWSFFIQCPLMILAGILVTWRLPRQTSQKSIEKDTSLRATLHRLDLLGAAFLSSTIVCFLLMLNVLSTVQPSTLPWTLGLSAATLICGTAFVVVERRREDNAIFPLHLFSYADIRSAYVMAAFQYGGMYSFLFTIPPYFQITRSLSARTAGSYLLPTILGNTVGSLLSGLLIYRTGRYKLQTILGIFLGLISFTIIMLRWQGNTSFWEMGFTVIPAVGTAIVSSTAFMHLTVGLEAGDFVVGGTGLFVSHNIGATAGISGVTAILQRSLVARLTERLRGVEGAEEIIAKSTESLAYVMGLTGDLRQTIVEAYIRSFTYMHAASLAMSAIAFVAALTMREHRF